MKTGTLHSLITARTLLDDAIRQISFGDRHSCSAALILLQDSLEIVMLCLLIEKNIDEEKEPEKKTFDELIGELKRCGVLVPKSGTLKALNKERVIVKHYGQLAEPLTVQNYAEAAEAAINSIVTQVIGKPLREVALTDRLDESEAKSYLVAGSAYLEAKEYLAALVEIRKAIYVTIEIEYAIHKWAVVDPGDTGWLAAATRGGLKAPYWKRTAEWIEENVKAPVDYVQVDVERLRVECMEWGASTTVSTI